MSDTTQVRARVPIPLREVLESMAARSGVPYRDYLVGLIIKAAKDNKQLPSFPTKTARLDVPSDVTHHIKELIKDTPGNQEDWLLYVFREAVNEFQPDPRLDTN